jgi:hypothetical protein
MITAGEKKINAIWSGEKEIAKVYAGGNLVWSKSAVPEVNLFDGALSDIWAYLRYANIVYATSTNASNLMARCAIEPNTSYKVSLLMDTRFRVFSYKGEPASGTTIENPVIDSLDDNGSISINAVRTIAITTGAEATMLYIGYWTSTGALSSAAVRNSIKVIKVGD